MGNKPPKRAPTQQYNQQQQQQQPYYQQQQQQQYVNNNGRDVRALSGGSVSSNAPSTSNGGGTASSSRPTAVRCPRCRRLLQPPAGHPRFLCPCGQMLMAPPPQPQQPTVRVRCPACQTTLAPPPGAPIFRCPCGQHLRSPVTQAMSNAALAPKTQANESDDRNATVANTLQRRQDRSWARKAGTDGRLHWHRLLTDAEENALRQLELESGEKLTEENAQEIEASVLKDRLLRMGIDVRGCVEKADYVQLYLNSRNILKKIAVVELKRRLEAISVSDSNCDDAEDYAIRLHTACCNENSSLFREDGFVRCLTDDSKLIYISPSKFVINNSSGGPRPITPKEVADATMMPFDKKHAWFKERIQAIRTKWEEGHVKIRVRRERLFDDSFNSFLKLKSEDFRRYFRFEFINEPGVDAGGVAREWFQIVGDACFNVDFGLFEYSGGDNVSYQLNPNSGIANEVHLQYFRFVGRLMGKALFDGQTLSAHLAQPLYKHILGWPITEKDLEFIDNQVASSFNDVRKCEDVSMLCLDFTASVKIFGENQIIELKPGGKDIEVTNENRDEYLRLLFRHIVLDRVNDQLNELLRGFYEVVPEGILSVFDYQELELIINGLPNINVDDWQANTRYRGEYESKKDNHQVVKWFWQIIRTLNEEQRARLLQFSTGTSRVPVQGFAYLQGNDGNIKPFTIDSIKLSDSVFPKSHTCFNRIELPLYTSQEEMRNRLMTVIQMEITGFGME